MASIPRRSNVHPLPQWLLRYAGRRRHLGPEYATTTRSPDTARRLFVAHRSGRRTGWQYGDAAGKERQRLLLIWIKQPPPFGGVLAVGPIAATNCRRLQHVSFDPRSNSRRLGRRSPMSRRRSPHHQARGRIRCSAVERHALASTRLLPRAGIRGAKYQCPLVCGPRQLVISPRTVMGPAFQVSDIRTGVFDFEGSGRRIVHDEDATLGSITGSLPACPQCRLVQPARDRLGPHLSIWPPSACAVEDLMRHRPMRSGTASGLGHD